MNKRYVYHCAAVLYRRAEFSKKGLAIFIRPILTGSLLFLAGCASSAGPIGGAAVRPVESAALPAPSPTDYAEATRPYYVGPNDRLSIDVFGVPELARKVQVDAAGRLSLPLVGSVEAAGKTPGELAQDVEGRLRPFIKNPQVTINLDESSAHLVTVDGQVMTPGMFPVAGRLTLIRAVAVAGGTSEFAKLEDVIVFRKVGGQSYAALYNLKAIRRGNYEDPDIYPNDVIIVGDSPQRRLFRDLIQVAPLLTTPLVLLLQNNGN